MVGGYCSACGARFVANARFCGTCGASLASPKLAISSHGANAARLANATKYGVPESSTAALGGTQMGLPDGVPDDGPVVRVPVSLGTATASLRAQYGGERPAGTFGPSSRPSAAAPRKSGTRSDSWMDSAEVTGSGFAAAIAKSESLVPLTAMLVGMVVFVLGVGLALYAFGRQHRVTVPVGPTTGAPPALAIPSATPAPHVPPIMPAAVTVSGRIYNVTMDGSEPVLQVLARGTGGEAVAYWVSISSENQADSGVFAGGQWVSVTGTYVGERRIVTPSGELRSAVWLRATAVTPLPSAAAGRAPR